MDVDEYIRDRWIKVFINRSDKYGVDQASLSISTACIYATFGLGDCAYNAMIGNNTFSVALISFITLITSGYIYKRTVESNGKFLGSMTIRIIEHPFRLLVLCFLIIIIALNMLSIIILNNVNIGASDLGLIALYINMQVMASSPTKQTR